MSPQCHSTTAGSHLTVRGRFFPSQQAVCMATLTGKDNNRPYRRNLVAISSSVVADCVSSRSQLLKLNMKILLLQIEESRVHVSARQLWLMSRFHQFKPWWIVRFSSSSFFSLVSKNVWNLRVCGTFITHLGMNTMTEAERYTLMILTSIVTHGVMAIQTGYWPSQSTPAQLYDSYQNECSRGSYKKGYFSHPFIAIHHRGGMWDSYIH